MGKSISFIVRGIPKPQPRPRAFARGGKARVYDPGTTECWKGAVALAARKHLPRTPIEVAAKVSIDFFLPRPKRLMRKCDPLGTVRHTSKPDVDNLAKAVLDCLTEIGMWRDDSQVCDLQLSKVYHAKEGMPFASIEINYREPTE